MSDVIERDWHVLPKPTEIRNSRGRHRCGPIKKPLPGQAALLDLHRDGIDMKDALAFAWLFGHVAVLVHHVLPAIARV